MIESILWLLIILVVTSVTLLFVSRFGSSFAVGLYVGALASAIVVAGKLGVVEVFGSSITLSASIIVFPATFLITDVISEIYGKKQARKAVWAGLALYPVLFLTIGFAVGFRPDAYYESQGLQDAFSTTMKITGRVVLASLAAFICGQLHDVWAFHFWKDRTKGKWLFLRNNLSTWGSQLIDTVIFYTVAFYGLFPILDLIIMTYLAKIIIAIIDTPLIYAIVGYLRKRVQVDEG